MLLEPGKAQIGMLAAVSSLTSARTLHPANLPFGTVPKSLFPRDFESAALAENMKFWPVRAACDHYLRTKLLLKFAYIFHLRTSFPGYKC